MLRQILNASLISVFCLHPVWADDTEIYFGPVSGSDAQPNILFVLDASRSMRRYDCKTNTPLTPCTDGSPFGNLRRIDRQNAAFTKIVNAIDNVNVGVMRFSNKWSGGRVLYPVRDVSQDLCDGIPCDDNSEYAGTKSTVRQELIDQTTNMELQWGTPTVGALLEATLLNEESAQEYRIQSPTQGVLFIVIRVVCVLMPIYLIQVVAVRELMGHLYILHQLKMSARKIILS